MLVLQMPWIVKVSDCLYLYFLVGGWEGILVSWLVLGIYHIPLTAHGNSMDFVGGRMVGGWVGVDG